MSVCARERERKRRAVAEEVVGERENKRVWCQAGCEGARHQHP